MPAASRRHATDCAVTSRAALEEAATRLQTVDAAGQRWLAAVGTLAVLWVLHACPGGLVRVRRRAGGATHNRALAAAAAASPKTWYAHTRLLATAGLLQRTGGTWRIANPHWVEGRRPQGGLRPNHLYTARSSFAAAVIRLQQADHTGRRWRTALGAWWLLRHLRARWADGVITLTADEVAAWLGVDPDSWRGWQQLLAGAGLLAFQAHGGLRVPDWDRLEGLTPAEPTNAQPAGSAAGQRRGECGEFPPASPASVESFPVACSSRARAEAPNVEAPLTTAQASAVRGDRHHGNSSSARPPTWRAVHPVLAVLATQLPAADLARLDHDWDGCQRCARHNAPVDRYHTTARLRCDLDHWLVVAGRHAQRKLLDELVDGGYCCAAGNALAALHARVERLLHARGHNTSRQRRSTHLPASAAADAAQSVNAGAPTTCWQPADPPSGINDHLELQHMAQQLQHLPAPLQRTIVAHAISRSGGSLPAHTASRIRALHRELQDHHGGLPGGGQRERPHSPTHCDVRAAGGRP